MSFSNDTKNELARLLLDKECCCKAELSALLRFGATFPTGNDAPVPGWEISTENAAVARKVFKLFKGLFGIPAEVIVANKKPFKKNKVYLVRGSSRNGLAAMQHLGICNHEGLLVEGIPDPLLTRRCCRRSYLRGAFLARGSVNRPEGNYHLEIVCPSPATGRGLQKLMEKMELEARISERKGTVLVYIKESEQIVDFLRVAGASSALLDFENVRIVKSMRNRVNRLVNCETSNLEKTVEASWRQTEAITSLVERVGLQAIPEPIRALAILRLQHPDYSLKELGGIMDPPLSKSGVAYRMKRLEAMARKILGDTI